MDAFSLNDREYKRIAELVYETAGISLGPTKKSLVIARVSKRLRELRLASFSDYIHVLDDPVACSTEIPLLINCITTNTTEFFRERGHFDFLQKLLRTLTQEKEKSGKRVLRVWCSACSTGEEAYTIAMVLLDYFDKLRGWNVKVLASDIDTDVLQQASAGEYCVEKTRAIPASLRAKYMHSSASCAPGYLKVRDRLRSLVVFRKINLLSDEFRFAQPVDIVFCRNVVIYFDEVGKRNLVSKFSKVIAPNGYIFVGHSETLLMEGSGFEFVESTVYRKT